MLAYGLHQYMGTAQTPPQKDLDISKNTEHKYPGLEEQSWGLTRRKSHLAAPGILTPSEGTHLSGSSGEFIFPLVLPVGKCRPSFPFLSSPGSWRIPSLFLQFASLPLSLFSFSSYP